MAQKSKALTRVLTIMALLLIAGGVGLFWVGWRGVKILQSSADQAPSSLGGSSAALAGKQDFVGTWTGGHETLTIDPNGQADWVLDVPGSKQSMHGFVSFGKDSLVIDAIVTKKTMHIDKPPHVVAGRTLMDLDSMELEKK